MEDISNIRVTEINNAFLGRLVTKEGLFVDDKTAAIFAVAFAINHDLDIGVTDQYRLPKPDTNKWDAASVDTSGALRLMVELRHPEVECPFRVIQAIMDIGLNKMREMSPETGFIKISRFMKKKEV